MHADSALLEISSYEAVQRVGIKVVRRDDQVGRIVKRDTLRAAKSGIRKRTLFAIAALPLARFKASGVEQQ